MTADLEQRKRDLRQKQSLPLEGKIILAEQRIREWYDHWNGDVYISFSGGKDSTVLKHIVDQMGYDIPAVFVNTGLEYPEIQTFVREIKAGKYACFNPNVEILRPEMRFNEVIQRYGYPVISKEVAHAVYYGRKTGTRSAEWYMKRFNGELLTSTGEKSSFNIEKWKPLLDAPFPIGSQCCDVMKKRPIKKYAKQSGRKAIIGTMAAESRMRMTKWLQFGCNAYDCKDATSKPLSFWTEQDILHYIKKFNVPYCPVYGEIQVKANAEEIEGQINLIDYLGCYEPEDTLETTGCNRTGCMFCMFGCHLEKFPNRFQRMKETHPRQYAYCMKSVEEGGLGLRDVLEYIGIPYE